jgi:drug/metabolite transporter (DMT)-like permease
MLAQPVITALLAAVIFGELLAPAQWAGGFAAILGIYMVNASRAAG